MSTSDFVLFCLLLLAVIAVAVTVLCVVLIRLFGGAPPSACAASPNGRLPSAENHAPGTLPSFPASSAPLHVVPAHRPAVHVIRTDSRAPRVNTYGELED